MARIHSAPSRSLRNGSQSSPPLLSLRYTSPNHVTSPYLIDHVASFLPMHAECNPPSCSSSTKDAEHHHLLPPTGSMSSQWGRCLQGQQRHDERRTARKRSSGRKDMAIIGCLGHTTHAIPIGPGSSISFGSLRSGGSTISHGPCTGL
jgi:hypothetical protein